MKKRISIICSLLLISVIGLHAKPRTRTQILEVARTVFAPNKNGAMHHAAWKGAEPTIIKEEANLLVVSYEGGGYAIMTNDDLLPAVIGYSSTEYSSDCDNPNFKWWWNYAQAAAADYVAKGVAYTPVIPNIPAQKTEVPQLMSTAWGQLEPYNNMCPLEYDRNGNVIGRTIVGCVATALVQIMNYHRYPTQGIGTYTDVQTSDAWGNPRPITVDFKDYTYNYALMQDTYTPGSYNKDEADEVAKLSYTAGVAFAMIYGTEASGTFLDSAAVSMKKHFGYKNVQYQSRGTSSDQSWMGTIYNELSNNRPIAYGGADDLFTIGGGGHCFVLDGYDSRGLVHVNWGWNGKNDGYYDINILNPGIHSFKNQQDMIFGIEPPVETKAEPLVLSGELTENDFDMIVGRSLSERLYSVDLSNAILNDGALPEKAFYGSMLETIVLPNNVRTIGDGAFGNCKNLKNVVFPEQNGYQEFFVDDDIIYSNDRNEVIEVLPYYHNNIKVSDNYTSLLTFMEGVKTIHAYAFDGCFRVKGVIIPSSIESIGAHAFAHASSIKILYTKCMTPPSASKDAFAELNAGYTTLGIPAGTADSYLRHGEWKHFFALDNVIETGTNIKARNIVRLAGEKNPTLGYQVFGEYITGEPVLHCDADENSAAGEYPIIVEIGTLTGNEIYLTNGILRVIEPDGIELIDMNNHSQAYDLEGRKINNNKGIIIKDRKKYITK